MSTKPAKLNIEIYQGDRFSKSFSIKTKTTESPDPVPLDLTGLTLKGQIRKTFDGNNYTEFDITIDDALEGKFTVFLSSRDTQVMKEGGYVYDIEVIEDIDNIFKILVGNIEILPEVTKED